MSNDRDCNNCVRHDGECTAWDCDYIPRKEAIEAWKQIHRPNRYFVVSRCASAEEFPTEAEAHRYALRIPDAVREYDGGLAVVVTDAEKHVLRSYEV